jgi:hypothetical protein
MPVKGPYICTEIEKQAVEFAVGHLLRGEPCAITGMADSFGKEILAEEILRRLHQFSAGRKASYWVITAKDQLETLITEFEQSAGPIIAVINLHLSEDCSWAFIRLERIRTQRSVNFSCLIISYLSNIYSTIDIHQKLLVRSLFIIKPLEVDDFSALMASFADRFEYSPDISMQKYIYQYSGGHIGLAKSIYLTLKTQPLTALSPNFLFAQESVIYRLHTIINDLPLSKLASLMAPKRPPLDIIFFSKFGFTKNSEIFTPLLKDYIEMSELLPVSQFQYSFTNRELSIFHELKKHINNFVNREGLAFVLWGDKWEEKYSDWAIDQLIHRIKTKLTSGSSPYQLETKKGIGVRLVRI